MDRTSTILNRFPSFWNKDSGIVRAIVDAMASELSRADDQINVVDQMIGINGTFGNDLDKRWGALLNIPRHLGEDDVKYRNRLGTSISNLSGGTADALKYATSVVLGTDGVEMINDPISIIDAWLYTGNGVSESDKAYGHVVCYIDVDAAPYLDETRVNDLYSVLKSAKASGTMVHLVWYKREQPEMADTTASTSYTDTMNLFMPHLDDVDIVDGGNTIIGEEHAKIGVDDTEVSVDITESISYDHTTADYMHENALIGVMLFTLNETMYTNAISGYDVVHTSGQPDVIII